VWAGGTHPGWPKPARLGVGPGPIIMAWGPFTPGTPNAGSNGRRMALGHIGDPDISVS
jgi:hypothetical protein